MDSSAIPLVGALQWLIARLSSGRHVRVAISVRRHPERRTGAPRVMVKIYDSIVATSAVAESERPQRIRALRVLVRSLASDEARDGFLAALELQEAATGAATGAVRMEPDDELARRVRLLARQELGLRFEPAPSAADEPQPNYRGAFQRP